MDLQKDWILYSLLYQKSGRVICENPTHHAALKLFRLHGLEVHGIDMNEDGIDTNKVEKACVKKILILLI